jgi:hypothetical protein
VQLKKPLPATMDESITNHPFVGEAAMTARSQRKTKPCLARQRSLRAVIQDLLTPAVWKQAHQKRQRGRRQESPRWATQPLVLVLLFMAWCSGDSQAERFEIGKAYCQTAWLAKRRHCGQTVGGFETALKRLPMAVLRTFAAAILPVLVLRLGALWLYQGFVPIGCDGSRLNCPNTAQLQKRLGVAGKNKSAPTMWVTALVHLRWGLPLRWWFGISNACERSHLLKMLCTLPHNALLVADAGYVGFQLAHGLMDNNVMFLLRMCSNATLYQESGAGLEHFREGLVWYWPSQKDTQAGELPLHLRLIRIRARRKKDDVWLLTNVLAQKRLSLALAGQFYRWRWQSEGCFKTYKHTIKKVKLVSRSLRMVHREAEGSWLALQLLVAQGVLAQMHRAEAKETSKNQEATEKAKQTIGSQKDTAKPNPERKPDTRLYSPRAIIIAIRQEMSGPRKRGAPNYGEKLCNARGEERPGRTSPKASWEWPRPKKHKPPKPPKLLTMTKDQKAVVAMLTGKAA